ncbi:MAG: NAD(P)/FAD-dependent oxidoreductase [Acidobacteriaceae bacterium]
MNTFDLVVVGAGPAGSAAAITAFNRGLKVLLLEAGRYPRHKVCGEFVSAESAEVLRYLLGDDAPPLFRAPRITTARLHASGQTATISLATPGYSIARIDLDHALWRAAQAGGVDCRIDSVLDVLPDDRGFHVRGTAASYTAASVVNASGRWSRLGRRISQGKPWIGLKAHFAAETDDAVDLYFVPGGYCGVQMVRHGVLNACALVRQGAARTLQEVFTAHAQLSERARNWRPLTQEFATAPVYLGPGSPVVDGILQAGDAVGFVDPFVGDGISLALRSGVLAGRCAGEVNTDAYAALYRQAFSGIFRSTGRIRNLQELPPFLHGWIIRGLGIPSIARRLFHETRRAQLDVLHTPLSILEQASQ